MVPQLLTAVAVAMGAKEIVEAGKDYVVKWSNGSSATLTEAQLKTAADGLKNVVKNHDVKAVANEAARFATNVGSFLKKGIDSLEGLATYVKYLENNVSQTAAANTLYTKTYGTVASLAKKHAAIGSKNGGRSV